MTAETLFQKIEKLEEKMMQLLTEHEKARNEIKRLTDKLITLETEREIHEKKIIDLISLFDTAGFDAAHHSMPANAAVSPIKSALV